MRLLPLHRGRSAATRSHVRPGARAGEGPWVARRRRHRRIISALRTDTVVSTLAGHALRVTTARARSHDLSTGPSPRATLARAEVPGPCASGVDRQSAAGGAFVRRRARPRGLPGPRPEAEARQEKDES